MDYGKSMVVCRYVFLISTFAGVVGLYLLHKQFVVLGWICIGVWAVLGVTVRILIIRKKIDKKSKI
ncbi:MAG: hypothetical protein LBU29_02975 [Endomicrobium sp.]|jgi:hypothetical protein|nr:hypothetical protein [Endomicrobium sp.]